MKSVFVLRIAEGSETNAAGLAELLLLLLLMLVMRFHFDDVLRAMMRFVVDKLLQLLMMMMFFYLDDGRFHIFSQIHDRVFKARRFTSRCFSLAQLFGEDSLV